MSATFPLRNYLNSGCYPRHHTTSTDLVTPEQIKRGRTAGGTLLLIIYQQQRHRHPTTGINNKASSRHLRTITTGITKPCPGTATLSAIPRPAPWNPTATAPDELPEDAHHIAERLAPQRRGAARRRLAPAPAAGRGRAPAAAHRASSGAVRRPGGNAGLWGVEGGCGGVYAAGGRAAAWGGGTVTRCCRRPLLGLRHSGRDSSVVRSQRMLVAHTASKTRKARTIAFQRKRTSRWRRHSLHAASLTELRSGTPDRPSTTRPSSGAALGVYPLEGVDPADAPTACTLSGLSVPCEKRTGEKGGTPVSTLERK